MMQTGFNLHAAAAQPSMDRARGGVLAITLTIPPETIKVSPYNFPDGKPATGQVTTRQMIGLIEIDWEQLPLVDVAGYRVEEEQVGPAVLPYPPLPIDAQFS